MSKLDIIKNQYETPTFDIFNTFFCACTKGELDIVEFLMTQKKDKKYFNPHENNDCAFYSAYKNNQMDVVKYLLALPEYKMNAGLFKKDGNKDYDFCCGMGKNDFDFIKHLLKSPELLEYATISCWENEGLEWACQHGHLDFVHYFLTSPRLSEHPDINEIHEGLLIACIYGQLSVVQYLLTATPLMDKYINNSTFVFDFEEYLTALPLACKFGHLEIVKYLLTSPDLTERADIHIEDDQAYEYACIRNQTNVIQYLLSFNDQQCIDFQDTNYNLNWAMQNKDDDVIFAMMHNLKNNHLLEYVECLPLIQSYNIDLYEQVKNIKNTNINIQQKETALFL